MTKDLSVDNAARRLVISYIHKEEPLKQCIQKFIEKVGPALQDNVYSSAEWHAYLIDGEEI